MTTSYTANGATPVISSKLIATEPADGDVLSGSSVDTPAQGVADFAQMLYESVLALAYSNFTQATLPFTPSHMVWHASGPSGVPVWVIGNDTSATNNIATCPAEPGGTWTGRPTGSTAPVLTLASSGTLLVAGEQTGSLRTSPDGVTWTARTSAITNSHRGLIWNGSIWVVGDFSNGALASSPDAITWTLRTSNLTLGITDVLWDGTRFVAYSLAEGKYTTSTDGITWSSAKLLPGSAIATVNLKQNKAMAYGNGTWVYVTSNGTVYTCADPTTAANWTSRGATLVTDPRGVCHTGRCFVIGGGSAATALGVAISQDGISWRSSTHAKGGIAGSVVFFPWAAHPSGRYVCAGTGTTTMLVSNAIP